MAPNWISFKTKIRQTIGEDSSNVKVTLFIRKLSCKIKNNRGKENGITFKGVHSPPEIWETGVRNALEKHWLISPQATKNEANIFSCQPRSRTVRGSHAAWKRNEHQLNQHPAGIQKLLCPLLSEWTLLRHKGFSRAHNKGAQQKYTLTT